MGMSQESTNEYTEKIRERYLRMTGKRARSRLLDEYTEVTGFDRKYAIKVLRGQRRRSKEKQKPKGAPPRYTEDLTKPLKELWFWMDQPCGKRMKDMLPVWLEGSDRYSEKVKEELISMSPATLDRRLKSVKAQRTIKRLPPRSDSAIKSQVEIRAEKWDVKEAGWTEVDTVAHCGGDMAGSFIWSLTSVDILSGWTEVRAIWNRGQYATLEGLEKITEAQPFALKGVDSDNGGEFLNYHLHKWLKEKGVHQTRSRPYRKNDQAHVEQKNYTHVRQLLGYDRLDHEELLEPINQLLTTWSMWKNLYCVTMEQLSCQREGSRQIRKHAKVNRTPTQRLLDSQTLSKDEELHVNELIGKTDPFELKNQIEAELKVVQSILHDKQREEAELRAEEESLLAMQASSPLRSDPACIASEKLTLNQDAMVS